MRRITHRNDMKTIPSHLKHRKRGSSIQTEKKVGEHQFHLLKGLKAAPGLGIQNLITEGDSSSAIFSTS